jgi:putative transposase
VAKKYEVSEQTLYVWRRRFGAMSVDEAKRLTALEAENARLKKMLAESQLAIEVMKEVAAKKW